MKKENLIDKSRDRRIDLVKGLAILLMLMGHVELPNAVHNWIYLFHMAIFFIASGYLYTYHIDSVRTFIKFIFKKFRGLWAPYFICTTVFVLLNNLFIYLNIYTTNVNFLKTEGAYVSLGQVYSLHDICTKIFNALFMKTGTQLGGALWFLKALLMTLILYAFIDFVLRLLFNNNYLHELILGGTSFVMLLLGYYCDLYELHLSAGLNIVLSVFWLVWFGNFCRQYNLISKLFAKKITTLLLIIVFCTILILFNVNGTHISLNENHIDNPAVFIICSSCGWFMLLGIAEIILSVNFKGDWAIELLSRKSIYIVCLHFLAFKVVNLAGVLIHHEPLYLIAEFPVHMKTGAWWIIYIIAGIILPLQFAKVIDKVIYIANRRGVKK